jgi:hypothetical protein
MSCRFFFDKKKQKMTEEKKFDRIGWMEAMNENDFFKGPKHQKNLLLVEEKDRSYLISRIKKEVGGECVVFTSDETFSDLFNEIFQPSLFGEEKVFIVVDCEAYTDEQWVKIFDEKLYRMFFFKNSAPKALIDRFKQHGGVLKLTEEKPWDRKNRLISEVIYTIHKDGVTISQGSAHRFVERTFTDLQLFHGELAKLRSYAYLKKTLTDKDIDEVVQPLFEENMFKISEEMIWKDGLINNVSIDRNTDLIQFIGALRFQAYLGLRMTANQEVKIPPWQEKKYRQKSLALGPLFFKGVLMKTFKTEQRVKQSSISATASFDLLSLEIAALKR